MGIINGPWIFQLYPNEIHMGSPKGFLPDTLSICRMITHLKKLKKMGQEEIDKYNKKLLEEICGPSPKDEKKYEGPKTPGFIYFAKKNNFIKIGRTKNVESRMKNLQGNHPTAAPIELLHVISTKDYTQAERAFHTCFANKRIKGEWFQLTEEDIECIKEMKEI